MQGKFRINIKVAILLIVAVVVVGGIATLSHYANTQSVRFEFENITKVTVFEGESPEEDAAPIGSVDTSGDTLRLKRNTPFQLSYEAAEGYAPGSMTFTTTSGGEKTVTVEPYFSETRLDTMLDGELPAIHAALEKAYGATIDTYEISSGRLFHFGEWYGTTLEYKGSDVFNSDTLRAVLQKNESGEWIVVTDPPTISLSKHVFTDIPVDILRKVNML